MVYFNKLLVHSLRYLLIFQAGYVSFGMYPADVYLRDAVGVSLGLERNGL